MSIVLPRLGLFLVADDLTELARGLKYCEQVRVLVKWKPYSLFPIETCWERLYIHQKQQRNGTPKWVGVNTLTLPLPSMAGTGMTCSLVHHP